ncbi:hypothetical protein [Caballeronia sp. Lep1P3]|nr:hypothetical protein [Caballeronia sp. Lep1P3]
MASYFDAGHWPAATGVTWRIEYRRMQGDWLRIARLGDCSAALENGLE